VDTERKQVLDLIQEAAIYVKQNERDTCRYETYASARPGKDGTDVICMKGMLVFMEVLQNISL
jgi:hypothetical protein